MMHELAITQSLIDLVAGECKKNNNKSPKKIIAELGSLTGYTKESIQYYYCILRKENPLLAKTALDIREIASEIICVSCKLKSEFEEPYMMRCKNCGSNDVEIKTGRQFIVKEIEY